MPNQGQVEGEQDAFIENLLRQLDRFRATDQWVEKTLEVPEETLNRVIKV